MQNDIYPRFLKSSLYQDMLKRGQDAAAGKGFFARLQLKKNRFDIGKKDVKGISPNLPQRFTKRQVWSVVNLHTHSPFSSPRAYTYTHTYTHIHTHTYTYTHTHTHIHKQLSISRKLSSNNGSSSLDDIFLASSASDSNIQGESQRRSVYTEAFIDALTAPDPTKTNFIQGIRRVSAPGPPTTITGEKQQFSIKEEQVIPENDRFNPLTSDGCMPMSYSADDLKQLLYDADSVGPSKWKKFGIAAG